MDPKLIACWFSKGEDAAESYLRDEGLLELLVTEKRKDDSRLPPKYADLARLHKAVRSRRVFTILEFGLGYSTIVMADALAKNRRDWDALDSRPKIRNSAAFQLHAVDTSKDWISLVNSTMPPSLKQFVTIHHSTAHVGYFQGRGCHFYRHLPDIVPDFIYLDGPDPAEVQGNNTGLSWQNPDRVVMSGDILGMESQLLPGSFILVDGRTANARFIASHLYRNWQIEHNSDNDITTMELQEPPLGSINQATLGYCLGERALAW